MPVFFLYFIAILLAQALGVVLAVRFLRAGRSRHNVPSEFLTGEWDTVPASRKGAR